MVWIILGAYFAGVLVCGLAASIYIHTRPDHFRFTEEHKFVMSLGVCVWPLTLPVLGTVYTIVTIVMGIHSLGATIVDRVTFKKEKQNSALKPYKGA